MDSRLSSIEDSRRRGGGEQFDNLIPQYPSNENGKSKMAA